MFWPFLVPAEGLGNAELLALHLYPFYGTVTTLELLEFLY